MKKKTIISLFISLTLFMTACSDSDLEASNKAVSCAKSAIEIADQYLDRKIDYSDAIDQLDVLYEDMDYVEELTDEDDNKTSDFSIQCEILILSNRILMDSIDNDDDSYSKVEDSMASLKKKIK